MKMIKKGSGVSPQDSWRASIQSRLERASEVVRMTQARSETILSISAENRVTNQELRVQLRADRDALDRERNDLLRDIPLLVSQTPRRAERESIVFGFPPGDSRTDLYK